MDFFKLIESRRSCRKFLNDPVPEEVINKALDAAFLAPNTSNIQPWEFYWVKDKEKRCSLVSACFEQNAAKTSSELIVAVSRVDTWKRNKELLMSEMESQGKIPPRVSMYYNKIVPISYTLGPLSILGLLKKLVSTAIGLFKPIPRKPAFKSELFEVVTKSTAMACENFILAIHALGFDTCPMEGFDEYRVKKILNLNSQSHIVMVIAVGKRDPSGIFGKRIRLDRNLFVHEI